MSEVAEMVVDHSRQKRALLIGLVVWSALYGLAVGVVPLSWWYAVPTFFANGVVSTGLLGKWALLDIDERRYEPWRYFTLLLFVVPGPVVIVPIYLLQSRERHEVRNALLRALAYFLVVQVILIGAMSWLSALLLRG